MRNILNEYSRKVHYELRHLRTSLNLKSITFFVWEMWNFLHRTRQMGMGATPIPFSEAVCWLNFYCSSYSLDDNESVLYLFFSLEDEWLTWARKEEKKK